MKTILNKTLALTALAVSLISTAHAEDLVQYIDCSFFDPMSTDHVIVSLTSPTTGTFFYSSGLDSEGNDSRTKKLILEYKGENTAKTHAQYAAHAVVDDYGTPVSVAFFFTLPKEIVFKSSDYFIASMAADTTDSTTTHNTANDLICFSRLYPKQ